MKEGIRWKEGRHVKVRQYLVANGGSIVVGLLWWCVFFIVRVCQKTLFAMRWEKVI